MRIYIVLPNVPALIKSLSDLETSYVIAVDSAVSELNTLNIRYDIAVGDFDSLKDESLIKSNKVKLNPIKDESDTASAVRLAYESSDDIIILGGLKGNRIDHLYANLLLFRKYPGLVAIDDNNKITAKPNGTYTYFKKDYDYLSIFAIEKSLITIEGVKYPLDKYELKKDNPIGLSNEIIHHATITVHEGLILIIESKD